MSNTDSIKPSLDTMLAINKLAYLEPRMIELKWVNWAIEYTGSSILPVEVGEIPSLVRYAEVLDCLKQAVTLDLEELDIE